MVLLSRGVDARDSGVLGPAGENRFSASRGHTVLQFTAEGQGAEVLDDEFRDLRVRG